MATHTCRACHIGRASQRSIQQYTHDMLICTCLHACMPAACSHRWCVCSQVCDAACAQQTAPSPSPDPPTIPAPPWIQYSGIWQQYTWDTCIHTRTGCRGRHLGVGYSTSSASASSCSQWNSSSSSSSISDSASSCSQWNSGSSNSSSSDGESSNNSSNRDTRTAIPGGAGTRACRNARGGRPHANTR